MTAPNLFSRLTQRLALLGAICALLMAAGCRSSMYHPSNLPPEFRPASRVGVHSLDLSRLAQSAEESNVVYIGDILDVTVATGLETQSPQVYTLRVAENGTVNIPLVQQVRVAGLDLNQAEHAIHQASIERNIFRNPHVSVILNERRQNRITVVGAVEEPGVYELPAEGSDLLAAIVAAGGLNEEAGTVVEIRRPGGVARQAETPQGAYVSPASHTQSGPAMREARFDLAALTKTSSGQPGQDLRLEDGSVVMVRERPPQSIQVIGLVREADRFELPANEEVRLLDAIAMAGGRTIELANTVHVIRNVPGSDDPIRIAVNIRDAKRDSVSNLRLAPGDVVSVEETPLTFTLDTLSKFMRFGFTTAIPGL